MISPIVATSMPHPWRRRPRWSSGGLSTPFAPRPERTRGGQCCRRNLGRRDAANAHYVPQWRPHIVLIFIKLGGIKHKIHNKLSLFVNQIAYVIHFIKDQYGSTLSITPVITCCESAENATSHTHRWLASCSSVTRRSQRSSRSSRCSRRCSSPSCWGKGGRGIWIKGGRNTLEAISHSFC